MIIDPSTNPEDLRDAIPERTGFTTDWAGQQMLAAKLREASRRSDKGQSKALAKAKVKLIGLASQEQKPTMQQDDKYSIQVYEAALILMSMRRSDTPTTEVPDKESNASASEEEKVKLSILSCANTGAGNKNTVPNSTEDSLLTPVTNTDIDEPQTMGELIASLGVRKTRHASYRK
jgi:hypothetical protein